MGAIAGVAPALDHFFLSGPPLKGVVVCAEAAIVAVLVLFQLSPSRARLRWLKERIRHRQLGRLWNAARRNWMASTYRRLTAMVKTFAVFTLVWSYMSGQLVTGLAPNFGAGYTLSAIRANMFSWTPCEVTATRAKLTVTGQDLTPVVGIDILRAPRAGEHYWIISQALDSTQEILFAKHELTSQEASGGQHNGIPIYLSDAVGNNDVRNIFLACATDQGNQLLQTYRDDQTHQPTALPDVRKDLPVGVTRISQSVQNITRLPAP